MVPTVGLFITMNPGYAGRTDLPENMKAHFRPCAMVQPDMEAICESLLVCQGYENAHMLASKCVALYRLADQLLSKHKHYDWGLRSMKA